MSTSHKPTGQNRYFVLLLLAVVYSFNFIDRQILGILAPYIQRDFDLTDGQLGLLAGFYFAVFYTVVGLPIAWLADRYNRVTIVSIALFLWSGFTALSGAAANYVQLAIARMGVGIGEAGGSPPSHSIISDLFDRHERSRALAIYSLGIPVGIMAAYFVSAALLGNDTLNWRLVFFAIGIPGVLLAVFLRLTVKEPQRGIMEGHTSDQAQHTLAASLKILIRIPSYWAMCIGISLGSFVGYGVSAFIVVYLTRAFPDVSIVWLLVWLGIITGIAYAGGTYYGGYAADRWGRSTPAGFALSPMFAMIIAAPFLLAGVWVSTPVMALLYFAVYLFLSGFYLGPSFSVAQTLAPVSMRAMSTAIFFFVLNMIGLGGGPTFVGFLSNHFSSTQGPVVGLRWALSALAIIALLSALAFMIAARYLPADWKAAAERN